MNDKQKYYESLYGSNSSSYNINDEVDITYMDTVKVEEIMNDLINLSNEYNSVITKLFTRFSEVPTVTGEWIGNQAEYYFNTIAQDKNEFLNFGNNLKNIADKLNYDINEVTDSINKNTKLESEAKYSDEI